MIMITIITELELRYHGYGYKREAEQNLSFFLSDQGWETMAYGQWNRS